jgi:hypothetical protein
MAEETGRIEDLGKAVSEQKQRGVEESDAEFDYEICNKRMKPLAEALIKKFDELHHIDPDKILFVVNHRSAGSRKRVVLAHTTRISPKWTELMFQLSNNKKSYFYMIEFYARTTAAMDESQMIALLYSELRRIGPEGEMLIPDVHDWWQLIMGLGRKWFYPDVTCPNLLDDGVNWKKLMGDYYEDIKEEK